MRIDKQREMYILVVMDSCKAFSEDYDALVEYGNEVFGEGSYTIFLAEPDDYIPDVFVNTGEEVE